VDLKSITSPFQGEIQGVKDKEKTSEEGPERALKIQRPEAGTQNSAPPTS
jgi:hypothetical protein